jgi:regulator of RNase E activity RraB
MTSWTNTAHLICSHETQRGIAVVTNFIKKLLGKRPGHVTKAASPEAESTDNWITFKRELDDDYWIVVINQALADNNQAPSMSWFALEYTFHPDHLKNGAMPLPEMAELYYGLEDAIAQEIGAIGGAMAASQSGFGIRKVWYCAPNMRLEDLMRNRIQSFTDIPVEVWPANYPQFAALLPTHLESQLTGNRNILSAIEEHGDDGSAARKVMHWITDFNPQAVASICAALTDLDYDIEETSDRFIRFSRIASLSIDSTAEETENLIAFCEALGCHYDGWETPVIRPSVH